MIYIGSVLGGPELNESEIGVALRRITRASANARGEFVPGDSPALNVVYHVPGSISQVDFDELQEGKFSKKQKLLMVQVPVLESDIKSGDLEEFLFTALHQANALGFHFFDSKGMSFPLKEAEEMIFRIRSEYEKA